MAVIAMLCGCTRWVFFGVFLIALMSCIVFVAIPKKNFCIGEVRLTEVIRNLSSVNSISCHTLGTRLGYDSSELNAIADIEALIENWADDRLKSGPTFGHGSLYSILYLEEYDKDQYQIATVLAYERCYEWIYTLSTVAMYSILVLFVLLMITCAVCRPDKCCEAETMWQRTIHLRRTRVRTESEQTESDNGHEAPGLVIKNPVFSKNVTVNVGNEAIIKKRKTSSRWHLLSCIFTDGETEITYQNTCDENKTPKRLFKKDFDGTLSRASVNLVCDSMRSVGILFTKQCAKGTVVRIGSHYVITAWHVIKDIVLPCHRTLFQQDVDPTLLNNNSIYVDFHEYTRQSPESMHFKLMPRIVFKDTDLDIAILELNISEKEEHIPPAIQHFSDVFNLNSNRNQIHCVHIIGQHPTGDHVVVDFGCKVINKDDKNVKHARKWVKDHMTDLRKTAIKCNENPNDVDTAYSDVFDTQRRLIFNTFLEFGSSGGAVVALLPEGEVALVAILTHGLPPNYWYSAASHKFPESMRMEVGCTVKAIMRSMELKGYTDLRDQLFRQASKKAITENTPMETDQDIPTANDKLIPMETN